MLTKVVAYPRRLDEALLERKEFRLIKYSGATMRFILKLEVRNSSLRWKEYEALYLNDFNVPAYSVLKTFHSVDWFHEVQFNQSWSHIQVIVTY